MQHQAKAFAHYSAQLQKRVLIPNRELINGVSWFTLYKDVELTVQTQSF